MARRSQEGVLSKLKAPYLKSVQLRPERVRDEAAFPFDLPFLAAEPLHIAFTRAVTIFVGQNGSGKSTLLEAIAWLCGFGRFGGNRNYNQGDQDPDILGSALRASWLPKVGAGFYMRAETTMGLIAQIDDIANEAPMHHAAYGGRSLATRSHGEGYLQIFRNRIAGRGGVFVLDEPEAALSPAHQIEFLQIVREADRSGGAQFVIATHSPLIMAYPAATLLHLSDQGIVERSLETTDHFRVLREFYRDPDAFMSALFNE